MQQRERQVKRLHQSIQKYKLSPRTQLTVEKARSELELAIEQKYLRSQANRNYIFPRTCVESNQEPDFPTKQIANLYESSQDFLSHDLSIAEEPQKNEIYISQKTMLQNEKNLTLQNDEQPFKLKIKLFKKNKENKDDRTMRIKTDYVSEKQYSTLNIKDKQNYMERKTGKIKKEEYNKTLKIGHNKSMSKFHLTSIQERTPQKHDFAILGNRTTNRKNQKYYISQTSKTNFHKHTHSRDNLKSVKSRINISIKTDVSRALFKQQKPKLNLTQQMGENAMKKDPIKIIKLGSNSREKRKARIII